MKTIKLIKEYLEDKKAFDINILDVHGISPITDYIIIASADTNKHAKTVADNLIVKLKERGISKHYVDGYENGEWIIVDFIDYMVHIFTKEKRTYYELDTLFGDAKRIIFDD